MAEPFRLDGPVEPASPVILSIPHSGRDYPPALLAASRLPRARLEILEDRHADLLGTAAVGAGFTALIATRARAWIDLNRDEREVDPDMIEGVIRGRGFVRSAKVNGGLGLVPRRLRGQGEILNRRLDRAEVDTRIAEDHRPYHARLATLLTVARRRFGVAVLLDIHSMPPLPDADAARIVIGDRFGRSAAGRFVLALRETGEAAGHRVALNSPYAGGHILDAHGSPARGVHALQVEVDRRLYLDEALNKPAPGHKAVQALMLAMARALADEALGTNAIAAE